MIFRELILENFGPYLGRCIIDLRPEKAQQSCPILLFGGMNGCGKTTIMDAIRLALYGHRAQCSTRGNLAYSEFLSQCVNNRTKEPESTRIELAIEHIRDNQWVDLRIVRSWSKKDTKDTLGILEGDWPDSALANTWDEYIETLLPLGISNLFLFDGEQVKELAEQDTPPQLVIEAIQTLLGLELAERLSNDLEVLVSRKRKALATGSQLANLNQIEAQLKEYQQKEIETKEEIEQSQILLEKTQKNYQNNLNRFRIEGGKIASEKSQLQAQKEELETNFEKEREEIRQRVSGSLPLALIAPLLAQVQKQAEEELKLQQTKIAIDILQQRDQRLLNFLESLDLENPKIDAIEEFLKQDNQQLNKVVLNNKSFDLGLEEDGLNKLKYLLESELPQEEKLAQQSINKLKSLQEDIESLERQIAIAASPEDYEKLEEALKESQQELFKAKNNYEASQNKLEDINKKISKIKKDLERYSEQVLETKNNQHIIESVAKVQDTLKQFKERLTLKKLNKLEKEVTECFRYLLHKSNLIHRVSINTEDYSLSLFDPLGIFVPKHRLSAGEKQLLAISFLWGLARVSGRNLPIAIDTPLGRLDSSHRNNLVERYFPTASHQVILLSTDTEITEAHVQKLREQDVIAKEYLLRYNPADRGTTVESGYFW